MSKKFSVLVTGSCGFIGKNLVEKLSGKNISIIGSYHRRKDFIKSPKIKYIKINTCNYNSFDNIFITCIGLIILFFIIINFIYIDNKFKQYYNIILLVLILINLYSLKINENNSNLLCFS